jgi:hypothetical protein
MKKEDTIKYALNFLISNIDEFVEEDFHSTAEEIEKQIEAIRDELEADKPDPLLIDSMAMRYRHDFGLLNENEKNTVRIIMTQLWEEVVGKGFYKKK